MKVILKEKAIKQGGNSSLHSLHIYYGPPAEKVQCWAPGRFSKASVRTATWRTQGPRGASPRPLWGLLHEGPRAMFSPYVPMGGSHYPRAWSPRGLTEEPCVVCENRSTSLNAGGKRENPWPQIPKERWAGRTWCENWHPSLLSGEKGPRAPTFHLPSLFPEPTISVLLKSSLVII